MQRIVVLRGTSSNVVFDCFAIGIGRALFAEKAVHYVVSNVEGHVCGLSRGKCVVCLVLRVRMRVSPQ